MVRTIERRMLIQQPDRRNLTGIGVSNRGAAFEPRELEGGGVKRTYREQTQDAPRPWIWPA
jgi:hypothetical protein